MKLGKGGADVDPTYSVKQAKQLRDKLTRTMLIICDGEDRCMIDRHCCYYEENKLRLIRIQLKIDPPITSAVLRFESYMFLTA